MGSYRDIRQDSGGGGGGGGGGVAVGAGVAGRFVLVDATGTVVSASDELSYAIGTKLASLTASNSGGSVGLKVENTAAGAANTFASIEVKNASASAVNNDPRYIVTLGSQSFAMGIDANQGNVFRINPGTGVGALGIYVDPTTGFVTIGDTHTTVTGQVLQVASNSASLNTAVKNASTTGYSAFQAECATGQVARLVQQGSAAAGNIYGLTAAKLGYVDFAERGSAVTIGNFSYYIVTNSVPRVEFQGGGGMKMLTGMINAAREVANADTTITINDGSVAQTGVLSANRAWTLPAAASTPNGFEVKCSVNAVVATGFKVTVSGDININGGASWDLDTDWESATFVKYTSEWRVF